MAYGLFCGMASWDIVLCFFLGAFLYSSFGQAMPKSEVQPEFLAPLENHTVTQGRDVSFTCVVNHLQSYKVAWIKSDSKAILAIHTHMVAHNPRLSVTHNGHNTWKLHVTNVQPNDSGTYMCQVNTDPMRSQTGHMKVVIPPDIEDLDDSADLTAKENSDLQLQCHATGTPKPVVTWRREDGRNITLRTEHGVQRGIKLLPDEKHDLSEVTLNDYAYQLNLTIRRLNRDDFGSYTCSAENLLGKADGTIRLQELHLTRTTSVPLRNTEFTGKHGTKKQSDRKGKLHSFGREGTGSLSKNSGNMGHTTPMLRRNSSNALTDSNAKKSKVSSYPAPAPAPANFAPTQLNVQNSVTSSRHSRLNCVGLMLAFIVIVICSS
nr:PREDICTED: protein sidekick-2-like isoform X3 [Megachile rotundata]